ncbi:MAG: hypothetical protein N2V75_12725 [Methanophagales archaeon]|nr:hypothetical protein [Methanophagales archaeon]
MYIGVTFFDFLVHAFTDLSAPSPSHTPAYYTPLSPSKPDIKNIIFGRGNIFYVILFGALLIYEVFIRRDCKYWRADFMLASWIAFSFFFYLLTLPNPQMGSSPSRILPFTYVFILIAVPHIILSQKPLRIKKFITVLAFWVLFTFLLHLLALSNTQIGTPLSEILPHTYIFAFIAIPLAILSQKPAMIKKFLVLLLLGFMLLNVYQMGILPPSPLAKTSIPAEYGDWTQENAVVRWQKMEPKPFPLTVTDAMLHWTFFYEKGWSPYHAIEPFENNMEGLSSYVGWLYFNPENPLFLSTGKQYASKYPRLDEETCSLMQNASWIHKVYNNGEWEIYKIKE